MSKINVDSQLYGYRVKDLIIVAEACKRTGLKADEVSAIAATFAAGYKAAKEDAAKAMQVTVEALLDDRP